MRVMICFAKCLKAALLTAVVTLVAGQSAYAQAGLQNQAFGRWKLKDQCLAQSVTHFPDHDQKSLSQRDDYVDKCLKDHNLPPVARIIPKAETPDKTATTP